MLDTVVISGDDVCCSVVGVFSVMWSDLLMTSAISCPLWSSVYECQRVECAFTFPVRTECGMFVLYAVLYVCVICFVVRGCAISRRYINVCNCDMFTLSCNSPLSPTLSKFSTRVPTRTCKSFDNRRTGPAISCVPKLQQIGREASSMWIIIVSLFQEASHMELRARQCTDWGAL